MNALREHFQTLGLTEQASLADALASYKDLVRVWHPDRFGNDPRLRKKAEEQTSRINVSMAAVREYFKNPAAYRPETPAQDAQGRKQPRHAQTRLAPIHPQLGMQLAVYQRRWISLARTLGGLLLIKLGWWLSIEHPGSAGQIALGIIMCGYGFTMALIGATLICFKRPIISLSDTSIRILGWPSIPIEEISASHLVVTTKGSVFTLQASAQYLRRTPPPLTFWLQAHLLFMRNHYQVRASSLDTHPALIINALDRMAAQGAARARPVVSPPSVWAYYTFMLSGITLAMPIIRVLLEGPLPPTGVLPYLALFALLQTSSAIKTIVLAPTS